MADLSKGVKYIKRFVKKAQRDCRDKNNRGFADEITLINETLDELEEVVKYVDHLQLKFYKSNKKGQNYGWITSITLDYYRRSIDKIQCLAGTT